MCARRAQLSCRRPVRALGRHHDPGVLLWFWCRPDLWEKRSRRDPERRRCARRKHEKVRAGGSGRGAEPPARGSSMSPTINGSAKRKVAR
jgi:hypothetical protein